MDRRSGLIAAFVTAATLIFLPAVARADCGVSQLKSEFIPKARALEAIPLTPEYVTPTWGIKDLAFNPTQASADVRTMGYVTSCPDDPPGVQGASQLLASLWREALTLRAFEADIHFVSIGQSQVAEPRQCVNVYHKTAAMMMQGRWFQFTAMPQSGNPGLAAAYRSMPEFAHVFSLWQKLAASEGVHLTPLTSTAMPNGKLTLAADAAVAHLPAGIKCPQTSF